MGLIMQVQKCKKAYIYMNYDNIVVLETYLDIIMKGLVLKGYHCEKIWSLDKISKNDLVVFSTSVSLFKYYFKGYRNVILWQQGIAGEESYMRNHSSLRKYILNFVDCFAMKKAKLLFFVSEAMKFYYEKMMNTDLSKKCYIMPCFNTILDESVFNNKDYSNKTFAYVGSLSVWQCFEETVDLYSKIEKNFSNAFLKVLTFETEKAEAIIRKKQLKNYSVTCVEKEKIYDELTDISFGFILRRDVIVNRVATPTKISSYLSVGVLPIYSSCLTDFFSQSREKSYAFISDIGDNNDDLMRWIDEKKDIECIKNEIKALFDDYYSVDCHAKQISMLSQI